MSENGYLKRFLKDSPAEPVKEATDAPAEQAPPDPPKDEGKK